jgi:glycosyltransferase involved in cell wall biosynthesis
MPNIRVLHMPGTAYPWSTGGTETLSHRLAQHLTTHHVTSHFTLHQHTRHEEPLGTHTHEGITYHVLPPIPYDNPLQSHHKTTQHVPGFEALLRNIQPHIAHLHAFSDDVNLNHIATLHQHRIPMLFSFHTPGQLCPQRSLLLNGTTPCDGVLEKNRCTTCRLRSHGIHPWLASAYTTFAPAYFKKAHIPAVFAAKHKTVLSIQAWQQLLEHNPVFHVMSEWSRTMLVLNQVPQNNIRLCKQGTSLPKLKNPHKDIPSLPLKCLFTGRWDVVKGLHVIEKALSLLPKDAPVEIHFFGNHTFSEYGRRMHQTLQQDSRCHMHGPIPHQAMGQVYMQHHVSLVPSLWLETGPLTVIESLAHQTPVIGSHLGGIQETLQHNVNGWLIEPGNAHQLAALIKHLIIHPEDIQKIQKNIQPPRSMEAMAEDMALIYQELFSARAQCKDMAS